jgi:predicted nucleotidyltransferase component of viral defense system
MDQFAKKPKSEREELFREAANSKSVHFQIIEKDFWVCWTLKRLFSLPNIGEHLIFKGGTSLSKAYHIIERFSEDIDVAIDRSFLGFGQEADLLSLSSNKRNQTIKDLDNTCKQFVRNKVLSSLQRSFQDEFESADFEWSLSVAQDDPYEQTILFEYPRDRKNSGGNELDYIKPVVRIEMGARPTNEPVQLKQIQSYASEEYPIAFNDPTVELVILSGERTFWEKATILHEQYHRSDDYVSAERMSRHYYDLYKLANSDIAAKALSDRDLLKKVVENKKLFFSRAGANYDDAIIGKLRLVPSAPRITAFERDYKKMEVMFFSTPPRFNDIIETLTELEGKINALR